jgi:dethiobiotin synthetase
VSTTVHELENHMKSFKVFKITENPKNLKIALNLKFIIVIMNYLGCINLCIVFFTYAESVICKSISFLMNGYMVVLVIFHK